MLLVSAVVACYEPARRATRLDPMVALREKVMMEPEICSVRKSADEPPPFLGSWQRVYVCVLSYLLVLIAGLYLVTRMFAY